MQLILLACPLFEYALLISILTTGLAKINLYHIMFLFLFIGFLGLPNKKGALIRFMLYYSAFYLIAKYIYTLMDPIKISNGYEKLLDVLGVSTDYKENE